MTKHEATRNVLNILRDARLAWGILFATLLIGWQARGVLNAQVELPERISAVEAAADHTRARIDTLTLRLDSSERTTREIRCLVKQLFEPLPDATRCALLP